MAVERTLSIVKPDAVGKNIIGKIYSRFESNGLQIVSSKMLRLSDDVAGGFSVLRRMGISPGADGRRLPGNQEAQALLKVVAAADAGEPAAVEAVSAAGRTLGTTLAQFSGLVAPELIVLAGPMAGAPAYAAGAKQGMDALLAEGVDGVPFKLSATSPQAAARRLAISEFLVNRDLDLDALRLQEAS